MQAEQRIEFKMFGHGQRIDVAEKKTKNEEVRIRIVYLANMD